MASAELSAERRAWLWRLGALACFSSPWACLFSLMVAAAMTNVLPVKHRWWRIGSAYAICVATYVASLFGYLACFGMGRQIMGSVGLGGDANLLNLASLSFGAMIAAFGIEGAVAILSGRWRWRYTVAFVVAGLLCVAVATIVPFLFRDIYSIAVLFPLGSGLFCGVAGAQLYSGGHTLN